MADELDQQYMRTRQAMRKWQGQIFEDEKPEETLETPTIVVPQGGHSDVYMGVVRRMKPQEGTGTDPNAPKGEATTTITPAPVKPGPHEQTIIEAAAEFNLDPNLLRAVVQEESGGRPGAVSKKGAQGVMQLMPDTAEALGVTDIEDPTQNIRGGAKYLSQLITKYEGDAVTALAAYNFGPGNIAKGKPYPAATKSYIEKILSHLPTDVSAEAGEAAPALAPDEAVAVTPRREFTVDTPEMQQQKQRIRGEFEERMKPWKFDLSTFDVPGDVLRAGLAKLSGVDRGEKEGQLRMSSDEMVERVFFKYGDKPQEVIKQAEALGLDEAQTLKIMAGLSAVVLGAVMDPLNVAGPGGKGKDVAKLAKVAGEAGAANYKKWFEQVAIKAVQEEKGQAVLDQLDELGKTPKQVIQEFWAQTYPQLPDAVKERFHQTIKKLTSMEPGAVVAVGPNKEEVRAADWAQALGEDFGPRAEDLEGTERGMIALMEMANQRRTAATGQIEDKATILSEFQRAAKIIKGERGSVPLGGKSPLSEAEWKALDEQFKGATPPSSPVWYHGSDAAGAQAIEQAGHVTAMASGDVFLTPARWAAEQYAQAKGGKVFAINRDDIPADLLQQSTRPAGFVETSIPKGMTDVRIPVQGGGGGKPPSILPPGAAAPADEPLSSKQLALLSKREEKREKRRFSVEGFGAELRKQTRRDNEGGVLSDEAVQKLAAESGFTIDDLLALKPGSILNEELELAAKQVYYAHADMMTASAATYLAMPSPANLDAFLESFYEGGIATTRIIGTFTESGRTQRMLNQKVPGLISKTDQYARDPDAMNIQDPYIRQMYELYRAAEAKSQMGGFAGRAGQEAQPGVVSPGQLAQMVVDLPSREAVMNFAKAAIKPTWSDMIYEVWINGLLSALTTSGTNILSNYGTLFMGIAERGVASMLHPKTIAPSEVTAMVQAGYETIGDMWRVAWKAFKADAPQFAGTVEVPKRAITSDAFDFTGDMGRALDYLGIVAPVENLINVTGTAARIPGRALMAADDGFKSMAFRMELRALAKRQANKEINELGLTGEEAVKKAKEIEGRILDNPPEFIKEDAQNFAAYSTFTRELGETGSAWQRAIHSTALGRWIVPFIRTPGNIFKYAGERTPLALASKAVREELKAGGERAALAQAKIALGSTTMAFAGMLAANGIITGGGPKDKELRKQWERDGWQAYSIFDGKEYYSYARIEVAASLFGVAADAAEIMGQLDELDRDELASALTVAASRNVANKTWVKGAAGSLNAAMSQDINVVRNFFGKELATFMPYSGLMGQTARMMDPVQRDVRTVLDHYRAKVPGLSETLQAEHNLWGEILPVRTAVGPDFISPIYSSVYKDDPVNKEMNRLGAPFRMPSRAVGGLKPGSDDLPDATYWRYVDLSAGIDNKIKGMNLHDKIHKTITAPMYGMATKEGQIAYIQSDIDLFRQAAMLRLRKENPEFDKAMLRQEFKEKTKKSAATQERVLAAPRLQ